MSRLTEVSLSCLPQFPRCLGSGAVLQGHFVPPTPLKMRASRLRMLRLPADQHLLYLGGC